MPWRYPGGVVARVALPHGLARQLYKRTGGARRINRRDRIVVECSRDSGGPFRVKQLRFDRVKPNRCSIVAENVKLQDGGFTDPDWLLAAIPFTIRAHQFAAHIEACWRCLVHSANVCGVVVCDLRDAAATFVASSCQVPVHLGLGVYAEMNAFALVSGLPAETRRLPKCVQRESGSLVARGALALFFFLNIDRIGGASALTLLSRTLDVSTVGGLLLTKDRARTQESLARLQASCVFSDETPRLPSAVRLDSDPDDTEALSQEEVVAFLWRTPLPAAPSTGDAHRSSPVHRE